MVEAVDTIVEALTVSCTDIPNIAHTLSDKHLKHSVARLVDLYGSLSAREILTDACKSLLSKEKMALTKEYSNKILTVTDLVKSMKRLMIAINQIYQLTKPKFINVEYQEEDIQPEKSILIRLIMAVCHADQRYIQGKRDPKILNKKLWQ